MSVSPALCTICEWRPSIAKGRCRACYQYHYRHGRERPESLIVRHGRKVMLSRTCNYKNRVVYSR